MLHIPASKTVHVVGRPYIPGSAEDSDDSGRGKGKKRRVTANTGVEHAREHGIQVGGRAGGMIVFPLSKLALIANKTTLEDMDYLCFRCFSALSVPDEAVETSSVCCPQCGFTLNVLEAVQLTRMLQTMK